MKKAILISGVGGSGKSALARLLRAQGYEAYDLEEIPGMFRMVHKDTGEESQDYDNGNLEMVKSHDWNIDKSQLAELITSQTNDIAFYSGIATNQDEIIDLFSDIIILIASPEIIRHRLGQRRHGEYGHNPEVIDLQLSWKDWWEAKSEENGAIAVNADGNLQDIADKVLAISLGD